MKSGCRREPGTGRPVPPLLALMALTFLLSCPAHGNPQTPTELVKTRTVAIPFRSHDGFEMFGKLTLPETGAPRAVVIYVQTAEGMTLAMKRSDGRGGTFNYFDLYRAKLPAMNVGFFGYEGRGVRMGDKPPRYEQIEPAAYDTSTLENKARDVLSAVAAVRKQPGLRGVRIFLIGASEGTLLAAEAASRAPREIDGLILYGVLSQNMRENFKYIMSGGAFLNYRGYFDKDGDGKITRAEFEADPVKFRARVLKEAPFTAFDRNGDGEFTVEEMGLLTKVYLDAIEKEDFAVLDQWAKTAASVSVPKDWFRGHFAHPAIWHFLSKLDIPVGCFQGDLDTNVPIAGVKELEAQAKRAGKLKMEFHYFKNLDHSLNVGEYFVKGNLPEGHRAIFEFIRKLVEQE